MFRDGFEGFRSVKMLAASDEPDFVLLEGFHDAQFMILPRIGERHFAK
jgi:hypothetical protein